MSTWQLETTHELTVDLLADLFTYNIAAVRVPAYCSAEAAGRLSEMLLTDPSRENYQARWSTAAGDSLVYERTDVERVGPADSAPGEPATSPIAAIRGQREAIKRELGPIDRLRLELDEILPGGASLGRDEQGRPRLAGIGRIMWESAEIVHADVGRRDCLTANVYLRIPHDGGAVRIWQHEGKHLNAATSYRFDEGEIPAHAPSCIVHPSPGDLVIWNPSMPHVVLDFEDAPRVTLQAWMLRSPETADGAFAMRLLN